MTKAHVKAVGESVDLVWSINAGRGSCRALDGFTLENGGAEGKKTIQILNQTNYFSLACADDRGKDLGVTRVCVDVDPSAKKAQLPVILLKASNHTIQKEKSPVTLNWTVLNARTCTGKVQYTETADGVYRDDSTDTEWSRDQHTAAGTATVHPRHPFTRYSLECSTSQGESGISGPQDISVIAATPPTIISFTVNGEQSASVESGSVATLQWNVRGADECEGSWAGNGVWLKNWTEHVSKPFVTVTPIATADYMLRCSKRYAYDGQEPVVATETATVRINVPQVSKALPPPPPNTIGAQGAAGTASPQISLWTYGSNGSPLSSLKQGGETITVAWDASSASSCVTYAAVLAEGGQWKVDPQHEWAAERRDGAGTARIIVQNTTRFHIVCLFPGVGNLEKTAVVTVERVTPVTISFFDEKNTATSRLLGWESDGDACRVFRLLAGETYPVMSSFSGSMTHPHTGEATVPYNAGTYRLECYRLSRQKEVTTKEITVQEILGTLASRAVIQPSGSTGTVSPVERVSLAEQQRLAVIQQNSANYSTYREAVSVQAQHDGASVATVMTEHAAKRGFTTQNLSIFGHGTDNLRIHGAQKIFSSGSPDDKKLNVLFLGVSDHYTDSELQEVTRIAVGKGFQMYTPFREYMSAVNVYAINIRQVTADPLTALYASVGNPLASGVQSWFTHGSTVSQQMTTNAIVADAAKTFFGVDKVVLLSKEKFRAYAQADGNAYVSMGDEAPVNFSDWSEDHKALFAALVMHEFGHSFGGLADEYQVKEEDEEWLIDDRPRDPNCMRTKNVMPWDVDKYKSIAAEWKRLENTYPESFSQSGLVPVLRGLFSGCSYVSWNVRPVYMTLMKQQRKTDNSTLKRLVFHPYGPVNEAWLRERLESYSRPVATFCGEPNQWACGRSTSEITNGMYCYDNAVFVSESQGGVCRPCGGSNQHMCPVKMTLPGSGFVYGCNVNFIENTSTGRCDACATGTRYSDKGKTPECRPCGVPGGSVCATGTPETQRGCYLPYYNPYWLAFEKSESTEGKANECIACADTNMSHDGEQCVKCGRKGESPCKSETKETYGSGCYAPYIRPPNAIITIQSVDSSVSYQPL
ncbi:MAG: M64 family metallopeptidase, partial [Patescibacteria group bacterium]